MPARQYLQLTLAATALLVAACNASAPTESAPAAPEATAEASLPDSPGESLEPTSEAGAQPAIGPVPKEPTLMASGLDALVNVDVWQGCNAETQEPADGFQFTLSQLNSNSPDPALVPVKSYYLNLWHDAQTDPGTNDTDDHTKTMMWQDDGEPGPEVVAYGTVAHFGYRLEGDPTHRVTAQWLFGGDPAQDCIAASISTAWHGATIVPIAFDRSRPAQVREVEVEVAQHSHRDGMVANFSYVVTESDLILDDLDRSWPELTNAVPLESGLEMAVEDPALFKLAAGESDRWVVLIGEWREQGRATVSSAPLLTTFHAVPAWWLDGSGPIGVEPGPPPTN